MKRESSFARIPECTGPINLSAALGISETVVTCSSFDCPSLHAEPFSVVVKRLSRAAYEKHGSSVKYQEDPTGRTFGKMTVIGFVEKRSSRRGGFADGCMFAVRCSCGRYEIMSLKAIRRGIEENRPICCSICFKNTWNQSTTGETS
jgi:hypothetical protein